MKPIELARKLGSCEAAAGFVSRYETIEEAWAACPRGDWMLWTASNLGGVDKRVVVGVASKCVRTVQHLMTDSRSIAALDACDKYAAGEISDQELKDAAYASTSAAAAAAAYAAYAAYAAAAAAARAAAYAAAAADAYADAYADAARRENQLQTANICREFLTDAVMAAIEKLPSTKEYGRGKTNGK